MAGHDFIPAPDADFLAWAENFTTYAGANATALGLLAPDVTPVTSQVTTFQTAFTANKTAQQSAQSAKQAKDTARTTAERSLRSLVRRIQASPAVTDAQRAALGITVRDTIRTMSAAALETRPVGAVDTSERLRHTIRFADSATPTKKAKPAGVMGCEIWVKVLPVGQPAPGPADLTFLGLDTNSPYVTEYDGADAGKTAHYMLRWVKTNGEKGPWSETVSATIAG